jgi:hypothetical protein
MRTFMCRSIRPLFHTERETTDDDVRAAARQFVRKISGYRIPSDANAAAFEDAIEEITRASTHLLGSLRTTSSKRKTVARRRPPQSAP